ncbi:MAG: glycosyltransferase family 2 protein [Chitinophagales bacterium]
MKRVAIVILNWNGKHWLEKFLASVLTYSDPSFCDVIVADNASTDNSLEFLKENFPDVQIIVFEKNHGFTGGYNRALKSLEHEYFVLLNSDIEVSKNWIEPIIRLMDGDKLIAACQPKILDYNKRDYFEYAGASGGYIDFLGYPFCRGRIFDALEKDEGQYDDAKRVFWASGACLFVRSEVYKKLGGLDEYFFAHMEEIDLCWRMQNEGYHVWVEPLSKVYHVGGGTLQSDSPKKTYLNFRNNLFLILKNYDFWKVYPIIFLRLLLDGIAAIRFLLQGKFSHFIAIIEAHFSFHFNQIRYLKDRKKQVKPSTIYAKSIVWEYFVKKRKKYKNL